MDVIATLRTIVSATGSGACLVREALTGSLSDGIASLAPLREGKPASGQAKRHVDQVAAAVAALEVLTWRDAHIRPGSRVTITAASGGGITARVVRVDAMTSSVSYLPDEVVLSRSYQHWSPLVAPLHAARSMFDQPAALPVELVDQCIAQVMTIVSTTQGGDPRCPADVFHEAVLSCCLFGCIARGIRACNHVSCVIIPLASADSPSVPPPTFAYALPEIGQRFITAHHVV